METSSAELVKRLGLLWSGTLSWLSHRNTHPVWHDRALRPLPSTGSKIDMPDMTSAGNQQLSVKLAISLDNIKWKTSVTFTCTTTYANASCVLEMKLLLSGAVHGMYIMVALMFCFFFSVFLSVLDTKKKKHFLQKHFFYCEMLRAEIKHAHWFAVGMKRHNGLFLWRKLQIKQVFLPTVRGKTATYKCKTKSFKREKSFKVMS